MGKDNGRLRRVKMVVLDEWDGEKEEFGGVMEWLLVEYLDLGLVLSVRHLPNLLNVLIKDRLPRPLFMRSIGIGTIMGGTTSALQTVQAKIGEMRTANEVSTHKAVGEMADTGIALPVEEEIIPVTVGEAADVELPQVVSESKGSSWSSLWSWIPGTSR
jgi:hypothetical protein